MCARVLFSIGTGRQYSAEKETLCVSYGQLSHDR